MRKLLIIPLLFIATTLHAGYKVSGNLEVTGNAGIGTSSPAYPLDVKGIVNSEGLYVNGSPYIGSQWTTVDSTIYYNGNVGINSTSPRGALDVDGGIYGTYFNGDGSLLQNVTSINGVSGLTTGMLLKAADGDIIVDSIIYDNGTNVGIDTADPSFKLDVAGIVNSTGLYVNGSPYIGSQWTDVDSDIYFVGNVGINSTTPRAGLDVDGDIYVDTLHYTTLDPAIDVTISTATQTTITGLLRGNGSTIEADTTVYLSAEADTLATVTGRGAVTTTNVGIGSTAAPSNSLKVTGNADITGFLGIGTTNPSVSLNIIPPVEYVAGSGGTESTIAVAGSTYKLHQFTTIGSTTFTAPQGVEQLEVLVIGGGGGGGGDNGGGGGGAGGYIEQVYTDFTAGETIDVTVGTYGVPWDGDGGNSVFGSLTAYGGGGGGSNDGRNGGSGGGGGGSHIGGCGGASHSPGTGTVGQGYNGGTANCYWAAGGGGGAGGVGGNSNGNNYSGNGGPGRTSSITGVPVCRAGGGGGSGQNTNGSATCGGGTESVSGTANTGAGGGGGDYSAPGTGGSGVVIVRYAVPTLPTAIKSDGVIIVNTDDASALLSMKGTSSTSASSSIKVKDSDNSDILILSDEGNLYVRSSISMGTTGYIAGNIGIGTPSPYSSLNVTLGTYTPLTTMLYNGGAAPQFPRTDVNIVAPVSTTSTTVATGQVVGLNLENSSPTNATYSPYLTWSRRSASGSYNSIYASIAGYATGNGTDTNWVAGDLVFGTAAVQGPLERMRITSAGNVGIGTIAPTANLQVFGSAKFGSLSELAVSTGQTVTIGTALPALKFPTTNTLTARTSARSFESNVDNLFYTIDTGAGGPTAQYPPAHNSTYVKATSSYDGTNYVPHFATDPSKSLIGVWTGNAWISGNGSYTNQRFHIDLGSSKVITQIYLENGMDGGGDYTNNGIKNFTLWGTDNAAAFADLTYATDTNWTQIGTYQARKHVLGNISDPQYIDINNSTAYRYYALKIADNWGTANYMSIRHIELLSARDSVSRKVVVLTEGSNLTSTRVPVASTNGRLIDGTIYDVSGNIGIGTISPSRRLDVVGDGNISGLVGLGTTTITGNATVSGNVGIGTTDLTKALTVSGNTSVTGTATIGTANVTNNLVVSGNVGIGSSSPKARLDIAGSGYISPIGVTSDPCGTQPEGTLFYNSTNHEWCFCDNAGADLRIKDASTACF